VIPTLEPGVAMDAPFPESTPLSSPPPRRPRAARLRRAIPAAGLMLGLSALVAFAGILTVKPWGTPDVQVFDHRYPPPGVGKDSADCRGRVEWTGGDPTGNYTDADSTYVVGDLADVELTGHSLIRLPDNADGDLVDHENAHDRLNRMEYQNHARKKFAAAKKGLIGRKFKGVGATWQDRVANAKNQARAARDSAFAAADSSVIKQMRVLSEIFDFVTNHGQSELLSAVQGEELVRGVHAAAPTLCMPQKRKDESKQKASGGVTNRIIYSDLERALGYAGAGEIVQTTNPTDPVRTEGRVLVEGFTVIGPQEDGSILLSDSRIRIEQWSTGDTLLVGYLIEAGYLPADGGGPGGVVQAYLAIVPAWAGGVRNTIGSDFLAEMQVASETLPLVMVWLESPVPLFDSTGVCLVPPMGVVAPFSIGYVLMTAGVDGDAGVRRPDRLLVSPQPGGGAVRFAWPPARGAARLTVFDLAGARRRAVTLDAAPGAWLWDGTDDAGRALPAGVYFAQLEGAGVRLRTRVVRLR
jgi:hypothetical protein